MPWDDSNNDEKEDIPYVHLWVPFKNIKQIYPVDKKVTVTLDDLKDVDPNSWIEIPDDYLKLQIDEIEQDNDEGNASNNNNNNNNNEENNETNNENSDDNNKKNIVEVIAIEYIQFYSDNEEKETNEDEKKQANNDENNGRSSNDKENDSNDEEKKFRWPRGTREPGWKNFKIGQIVDVQDTQQSKWYECVIRKVIKPDDGNDENLELIVHYIGWAVKWDEKLKGNDPNRVQNRHSHTKAPHRPQRNRGNRYGGNWGSNHGSSWGYGYSHDEGKPDQKGIVGLRNLGNTCFMNSTIQCLAQAPYLTEYFLKNEYIHHINKANPLGWKGKVATAWGQLLKDMFSNKYRTVAPRQFKEAIGAVAPRFLGYAQQDSQELLSFLLDGLHEDLNQIVKKPATEAVESNGRQDAIVAAEAWKTYLKRNQSIIVDLMQGQYKSKVVCPDCNRVSITFDPYMFLSVPLPTQKYKIIEYTFVDCTKTNIVPTVYGIKINKFYDITAFKKTLGKRHNVDEKELYVCDIWKSKFHRELRKHDTVAEINRRNDDIFVYYSPKPKKDEVELKEDPNMIKKDKNDAGAGAAGAGAGAGNDNNNGNGNDEDERRDGAGNDRNGNNNNNDYNMHSHHYNSGGQYGYRRQRSEYNTVLIENKRRVKVQRNDYGYDDETYEDEQIGCPLLLTVHIRQKMTLRELRQKIFDMIFPFTRTRNERPKRRSKDDDDDNRQSGNNNNAGNDAGNGNIKKDDPKKANNNNDVNDKPYKINDDDLPCRIFAKWGFNNTQEIFYDNDDLFDFDQSELKFEILWTDWTKYRHELYARKNRKRNQTAPPLTNKYGDDDDDNGGRYGRPIELDACFEAFTEEEKLGENDAWYCSKCKAFKRAKKKIDLWTVPDILIIHLKRFSYTRNYRDRINTLVKFPIKGLNIKEFLVNKYERANCTYDLFAVSNHMGGMGGGHYTAYAKNVYNDQWYHLDDSRTSMVNNPQQMVSSSAYVLYYYRAKPIKHRHKANDVEVPTVERAISMEDLSNEANIAVKQEINNNNNNSNDNSNNNNNNNSNNNATDLDAARQRDDEEANEQNQNSNNAKTKND